MAQKKKTDYVKPVGFSREEQRLRVRLIEKGLKQRDVADALGIAKQDVSMVVCGRSTCPRYVEAVYAYLGLDIPKDSAKIHTSG